MDCSTTGFPILCCFTEFAQTCVHWVGDIIQPSHPLLLLPSIFPSFTVLFGESALHIRWPNYWSLSFSISPSNEHAVLISFTIDWFGLRAVQGTLKSLLQHRSLKASVLSCSAFFMVQFLHPYMTTGKSIVLTIQTFVGKVMCLLFNTLSRFVIAFLPRSKNLLISWLQSPSTVILDPKKIKFVIVYTFPPFSLPWSDETRCHDLNFLNVGVSSQLFQYNLSPSSTGSLVPLCFLPLG